MATLDRLAPPPAAQAAPAWSPRRAIAATLSMLVAIALLQVLLTSSFAHTGNTMQRLDRQRADLTAQNHQLEAEVAALSSLERVERAARDRLGMIPASRIEYVSVGLEPPNQALLPRPIVGPTAPPNEPDPWWQSLIRVLPFR